MTLAVVGELGLEVLEAFVGLHGPVELIQAARQTEVRLDVTRVQSERCVAVPQRCVQVPVPDTATTVGQVSRENGRHGGIDREEAKQRGNGGTLSCMTRTEERREQMTIFIDQDSVPFF